MVTEAEKRQWHPLPRENYPKPLIFHDGRLAFRPTPLNTAAMFLWLPFGLPLAILRLIIGISLPYSLSTPLLSTTSMTWSLKGSIPRYSTKQSENKGHLFVCNHRTLIDPIYVAFALNAPVTAVAYSLSEVSEVLSPIKVVRLMRRRESDRETINKLLSQGHKVVVCPEGTTCREPYLLRFSPLFAELADEIIPVAVNVRVSMFYATTAGGFKGFDAFYYLMNPSMCYEVEFLAKIDASSIRVGEKSHIEIANLVQGVIGKALGFECTKLTRKDKYLVLAGNDGIVDATNGQKMDG